MQDATNLPGFNAFALEINSVTLSSSDAAVPQQPALLGDSVPRNFKKTPVSSPYRYKLTRKKRNEIRMGGENRSDAESNP